MVYTQDKDVSAEFRISFSGVVVILGKEECSERELECHNDLDPSGKLHAKSGPL